MKREAEERRLEHEIVEAAMAWHEFGYGDEIDILEGKCARLAAFRNEKGTR